MKYVSTREGIRQHTFEQALFSGYAPDGGLFVPSSLPSLTAEEHLIPWSKLKYPQLARSVLRMFISPTEIDDGHLEEICAKSYAAHEFDDESHVPVKKLGSAFIAELFHGPTFCFKDMGMRPVVRLLSYFATLRNKPTTMLVSTTGDTGPAAVHAVSDVANPLLTILVHYPRGQISDFQRKQLTTVDSKCVKVASFEGGGDDMDLPIKETLLMNSETDTGDGRTYCGINSYNIGRPLMQMVHFIWIYFRMTEQLGIEPGDKNSRIDMVLPTGAMGNITGGYMAKKMGVPLGMLCAGTNINDITHRVIERGEFHRKKIQRTLSDAINIEVPYNFERLIYYSTGKKHALVKEWMLQMEKTQHLTLETDHLATLRDDFRSARVTDDEMCGALRKLHAKLGYVADPHTAVATTAAEKLGYAFMDDSSETMPMVILATASPCKFEKAVSLALGDDVWSKDVIIPPRAHLMLKKKESDPYHYSFKEGSSLSEVQTVWRKMMIDIVKNHF